MEYLRECEKAKNNWDELKKYIEYCRELFLTTNTPKGSDTSKIVAKAHIDYSNELLKKMEENEAEN